MVPLLTRKKFQLIPIRPSHDDFIIKDVGVDFTNPSKSLKFVFTNPVSAFGFNLGNNLNFWDLKAYDSSNTLLETYNLPKLLTTDNNGEYFGISMNIGGYFDILVNLLVYW